MREMSVTRKRALIQAECEKRGCWLQYQMYRNGVRKVEGAVRAQEMAVRKYLPGWKVPWKRGVKKKEVEEPEVELLEAGVCGKSGPLAEDVRWVYDHMAYASVTPGDAPSSGAYGLWLWAKQKGNRSTFYGIWAKLLPSKAQLDTVVEEADADVQLEFIAKMRRARDVAISGEAEGPGVPEDGGRDDVSGAGEAVEVAGGPVGGGAPDGRPLEGGGDREGGEEGDGLHLAGAVQDGPPEGEPRGEGGGTAQ